MIWHLEGLGECFGRLRESGVCGESAALNGRGEGVFIEPPQKLAVAEVLCVYRNIRHRVGTSDQFKFTRPRGFYRKLLGTSEGRVGTSDPCIFSWPRTLCRTKHSTSDGGQNFRPLLYFSGLVSSCALCRDMFEWFLF